MYPIVRDQIDTTSGGMASAKRLLERLRARKIEEERSHSMEQLDVVSTMYSYLSQETWHRVTRFRKARQLAHHLSYFPSSGRVLEVGTAEGLVLRYLLEHGFISSGTGYDVSRLKVEKARSRAEEVGKSVELSFFRGDGWTLPFPDRSFDVTLLPHVLEHVPKMSQVSSLLFESLRVSRHGALVVLPMRDSNERLGKWMKYLDVDHVRNLLVHHNHWIYHSQSLEDFLSLLGLSFERSSVCDRYYLIRGRNEESVSGVGEIVHVEPTGEDEPNPVRALIERDT